MRITLAALRAGIAAIAAVGFAGLAGAQTPQTQIMTLTLPNGGVAQIHYTGTVAPQVYISDAPAPVLTALPSMFGADSVFAEMARLSAAMDRQAAQIFREAAALSAQPATINPTAIAALPASSQGYTFVSTITGNGVCTRSVEITASGNGAAPKVVSHTSGNCNAPGGLQVPAQQQPAPTPASAPNMIMTKATGASPYAGRIMEAALR
jgi:hypothetical protein